MINISHKKESILIFDIFLIILNIVIFMYLVNRGFTLVADSNGYIQNYFLRTPFYPLLLDLFQFLFHQDSFLLITVFQIILSFAAVFNLSWTLKKYFHLDKLTFYIIYFILLSPVYSPFPYIAQYISNNIATESITYSLFLITISLAIKVIFEPNLKGLVRLFLFSVLTATVRPQFIFLYVIDVIIILYYFYQIKNFRRTVISATYLILFIFLASIFTKTHNFLYHGIFSKVPVTGIQLITPQLYLSSPADIKLFQTAKAKAFLERTYHEMSARQLFKTSSSTLEVLAKYHQVYNAICNGVVRQNDRIRLPLDQFIDLDHLTISIALKLMSTHFTEFVDFYLNLIANSIGYYISGGYGYHGYVTTSMVGYYYIAVLIIQLWLCAYLFLKTRHVVFFAFLFITLVHFANYGIIALVEPILLRYSFYTDTLQIAFLVVFLNLIVNKIYNKLLNFIL